MRQSYEKAVHWWRLAADQGERVGQYSLAGAYLQGNGVPRSDKKAARWFRKAAEQGYAEAQHRLGTTMV